MSGQNTALGMVVTLTVIQLPAQLPLPNSTKVIRGRRRDKGANMPNMMAMSHERSRICVCHVTSRCGNFLVDQPSRLQRYLILLHGVMYPAAMLNPLQLASVVNSKFGKDVVAINVFEDVVAEPLRIHFPRCLKNESGQMFSIFSATAVLAPSLLSSLLNTASPGFSASSSARRRASSQPAAPPMLSEQSQSHPVFIRLLH
jgi:hypothetical protein